LEGSPPWFVSVILNLTCDVMRGGRKCWEVNGDLRIGSEADKEELREIGRINLGIMDIDMTKEQERRNICRVQFPVSIDMTLPSADDRQHETLQQ
jgi:hypothetical protein